MATGPQNKIITELAATPGSLADDRARLGPGAVGRAPATGSWSFVDIVNHVRASDAILTVRIWQMLVRDRAPLAAFDERAWGDLLAQAGMSLDDQVAEFALRRAELVALLRSLSEDQWRRTGQHEVRGEMTIESLAASIVDHEVEHRAQLAG